MEESTNQEEQKQSEVTQLVLPGASEIKHPKKKHHPVVVVARDWKEYLGECLLIVFSVALAIGITEYLTGLHEKKQASEILHQLKEELISNKEAAKEQYAYHQQVFKLIDSAKSNPAFANKFLDSANNIHLNMIMPKGALLNDLNDVAWQEAKQNNIFSAIDLSTYSLITDIYNNQERVLHLEPNLAELLLSYQSRDAKNIQTTLTLIHDVLFAWVVERTPRLITQYKEAIDKLSKY
ncbi:MAG TPA: hypothetical protein PKM63_12910 [Panacibacter sp.]|nr:hypothetical protein [Panacibacter sp.]HNP45182.1 hypothetical protein [Panacibacter sp.]